MRIKIKCSQTLKNSVYYGGCTRNQRYWWLYDIKRSKFIGIGNAYRRGIEPLDATVDLPPGSYEVGCGPGRAGIRQSFELAADEAGRMGITWLYPEEPIAEIEGV